MKVNQAIPPQGSFGIPSEMREQIDRYQARKTEPEEEPAAEVEELPPEAPYEEDVVEPEKEATSSSVVPDPLENLRKIGIELTEEDFQKIIFRGYLEKEVVVVPSVRGTKPLKATLKTLTGTEADEIDELLADDIQEVRMTNDGYHTRRSMWHITYGVTQLMGKPLCKPVMVKGKEDTKATVRMKRKVLAALNTAILTKLIHIHGIITISINAIIADPESDYLKKP